LTPLGVASLSGAGTSGAAGRLVEASDPAILAAATRDAEEAAQAARVQVVEVTSLSDAQAAEHVAQKVWGPAIGAKADLVRALANAGTAALIARDLDAPGSPAIGFALGFIGWRDGMHLHSHQVAVLEAARGRGVGPALKHAQRVDCLRHGITAIRWTYDPLIAKNARLNLVRLGAHVVAFLPDFYGQMADMINAHDRSDRFEVEWRLDGPVPVLPSADMAPGVPVLSADEDGWPRRTGEIQPGAAVYIPPDYVILRASGDTRARQWRQATGEIFAEAFGAGLTVAEFRDGRYVLEAHADRA
jgi:predicted GNAT superfamily acetyltransferase